jgi:hypothetical protein
MAEIKLIQVTAQTKRQPPTQAPHGAQEPQAPTSAPAQRPPTTGNGELAKTQATFNQAPALKPNWPDNGSTKVINNQRQPAPRGPAPSYGPPGGRSQGA